MLLTGAQIKYLLPFTHQRGSLTRLQRCGPSSEAGGGEDLVVPVAEARVKLLLALLDLTQGLIVGLVELVDHGRDRACGVGAGGEGAARGERFGERGCGSSRIQVMQWG